MKLTNKIYVTKHCLKRIFERARIWDYNEKKELIWRILNFGEIVDIRGKHVLVRWKSNYLILRKSKDRWTIISYTRNIVPRGFNERLQIKPAINNLEKILSKD